LNTDTSAELFSVRRFTRSGVRRLGDEYQDIQSLDILVEWLENNDRYEWVELEADARGHLDDIVAKRADGVVELRQIKFSTASYKIEDALSWQILLETKRDSNTSLLQKWFRSWEKQLSLGSIEPYLLSNRRGAQDLAIQSTTGRVAWNEIPEETKQIVVGQLGSEVQAKKFLEAFTFRINEPSLRELESGAYTRFLRLGGTPSGWHALYRAVRDWTNTKNNPPPDGHISLEHVRRAAKVKAHPVRLYTFLPPVTFFAPYLASNRLFHHRSPQVGRSVELNDLLSFVAGPDQISILPGRGGSGKTKLIHSLTRRLERVQPDLSVRLVAEGLPIKDTAREELPDDSCLIIVDDAHRVIGLEVVLALARQNPKIKVLLVTRPHATDYLLMQAVSAGFDREQISINKPLSDLDYVREHRQLARRVLGDEWKRFVDDLADATRDSPLLTVIGGQLLRTNQVAPDALTQNERFRKAVLSRFRDIQLGEIVTKVDGRYTQNFCARVLQVIAALSPINLGDTRLVCAMAELSRTTEVELREFVGLLVNAGVAVRGGRYVRIVPDVLSDFILQDACVALDGSLTGFATQVYEKVVDFHTDGVLRNLAELDWRISLAFNSEESSIKLIPATGLLDSIWTDIEDKFRTAHLAQRKAWLTRLERLAFIQPHRVWPVVQIALNEPAADDATSAEKKSGWYSPPTTQGDVINAVVPVLAGIARDDRFTARCADELWKVGRDVEVKPGHMPAALGVLLKLASYEDRKSLRFSQIVLTCCRAWMSDPNIHLYRNSILIILSGLLSRKFQWTSTNKQWRSQTALRLPPDYLWELRRGALQLVERCAFADDRRIVLESIRILGTTVSEEGLWEIKKENFAEWHAWEQEQLASLEIVSRVVNTISDSFVALRAWEACHWQAQQGPRPKVRAKAREILDGLPLSFDSRFILLITGARRPEEYLPSWNNTDRDLPARRTAKKKRVYQDEEFSGEVVREWMDHYADPQVGFEAFGKWIDRIERSGWWNEWWTRSNPFLLQLAADCPRYVERWCEIAVENPEARTSGWCADLLCEIRRRDQGKALKLVRSFLSTGHANLWLCVAASYSWRCWPAKPLPEETVVLRDLLAFDDIRVKRAAAEILAALASLDFNAAVNMLLEVQIGKDTELAEKLFQIFEERFGAKLDEIDQSVLLKVLGKLDEVESVRNYHLSRFLAQVAVREPMAVAKLLLSRIRTKILLSKKRWEKPATDVRSYVAQMVDTFGGLPKSGFHSEEFRQVINHQEYRDALRLLRDAALDEYYSSAFLYEDTLSELFHDFSLSYGPLSLNVLDEWVNSGNCEKVTAVLELLGDTHLGFFVNNLPFLSNYLHRADKCGSVVFESVQQTLLTFAQNGPRRGIASLRGERSNALFHQANQALAVLHDDPLTSHFFENLRDSGRNMIQSDMREVEEEQVFFRG
jgi:hypothetical protein